MITKINYIYLIREREFVRLNENVYKIGKTEMEPNTRLSGYPKKSEILLFLIVDNCHKSENLLIEEFKKKFIWRKDIGREYFEGNRHDMIILIYKLNYIKDNSQDNKNSQVPQSNAVKGNETLINNSKCDTVINNKYNISQNIIDNENNKKYHCNICDFNTDDRRFWYAHKKSKLHFKNLVNKENNSYQCSECNHSFSTLLSLQKHLEKCDYDSKFNKKLEILKLEFENKLLHEKINNKNVIDKLKLEVENKFLQEEYNLLKKKNESLKEKNIFLKDETRKLNNIFKEIE